jgi:hypothetical protein
VSSRSVLLLVLGTLLAGALGAAAVVAFTAEDDVTTGSATTSPDGSTSTSATTSATAPGSSSALTIVTSDVGLLGWWDGARWVQAEAEGTTPVAGGEEYSILRIDRPVSTSVGGKAEPPPETCSTPVIELDPPTPDATMASSIRAVGVHGLATPLPRPSTLLDTDAAVYRDAARAEVAKLGLPGDDLRVVQVVRADLSGDGTDEVLVVAEHLSEPGSLMGAPGDYSVVLLRQIVDGEVETTLVTESRADPDQNGPYILVSQVAAVADLNGDGRMEVVVQGVYYEGVGMYAYELGPDGLTEILRAGCGA